MAEKSGLRPGFSLDLTVDDPDDGTPWNFSNAEKRAKAVRLQEEQKPFLLIGSPPCTAFTTLFQSSWNRMPKDEQRAKIRETIVHVEFCVELYKRQIETGRYFLHEHPWSAFSWKLPSIKSLMNSPGVL